MSVSSSKIASTPNMKLTGPEACVYRFLAKQPGNDFKIRLHEMERTRMEKLRMEYEDDFKSLIRHALQKELIDVADKKCLYNKIKRMVECEMKANEHLFVENCAKLEVKIEEEPEQLKVLKEDLIEKLKELNKQKEEEKLKEMEEDRKIVEEKRLQLFIDNSEELRFAAMAKRKKNIADLNYKVIQEKEKFNKEQKLKKREMDNFENSERIKKQTFEKEEEKRKLLEKQRQLRKELHEQVQHKRVLQEQEKKLKEIERNEFKKLNEKLNEEEEFEKLERIKKKTQRKEEIKRFNEERAEFFSKLNENTNLSDKIFSTSGLPNTKDETAEEIEAKIQLRRENEMFLKHQAMVKEQRSRQCKEITDMVMKQKKEIEEIKKAMERESAETRRKRLEEGNKALKEQLKLREIHLQQQKDIKRNTYEQSVKEYEAYIKEEKQLWEKKKQYKWQIRKDLNDQIKSRKDIIEKQRKIDLDSHNMCMMEIVEHEQLLKKLLNEL